MILFGVFILFISLASAGKVTFNDCSNPKCISEVRVTGCDTSQCRLKKGKQILIETDFKSNQDTAKVKVELWAKILGQDTKLPVSDNDGCKDNRLPCPLKKGQNYTVKYPVSIPNNAPSMSTTITAKVSGDGGQIGCVSMKGQLVD